MHLKLNSILELMFKIKEGGLHNKKQNIKLLDWLSNYVCEKSNLQPVSHIKCSNEMVCHKKHPTNEKTEAQVLIF